MISYSHTRLENISHKIIHCSCEDGAGPEFVVNTIDQDLTSSLLSSVSSSWSRSVFVTEKFAMSKYKNSQNWNQVSQPVSDCLTASQGSKKSCYSAGQSFSPASNQQVPGWLVKTFQVCFVYWPIFHPICIKIVLGLSQGVVTIYININHPLLSVRWTLPHPPVLSLIITSLSSCLLTPDWDKDWPSVLVSQS